MLNVRSDVSINEANNLLHAFAEDARDRFTADYNLPVTRETQAASWKQSSVMCSLNSAGRSPGGRKGSPMHHLMQEFSNKVADAVGRGAIPWRLPAMPRNVLNGNFYGGVNPILLGMASARQGFASPWWGTYAQWQSLGCRVRQPDVQGARIVLYKMLTRSKMERREAVGDVVFNLEQTDAGDPPELPDPDPDKCFDAIVRGGQISIEYAFDKTCKYFGAEDKIRMPHRLMFEVGPGGLSGYYDAKGHEIFHWSERRVKWNAGPDTNELRAEIGTGYLGAMLGVKPLPRHLARHHDKYAPAWVRAIRADPQMLFDLCDNVTDTLALFLRFAGKGVAWQHDVVPHA